MNVLAELQEKGYQYHSLNSDRLAISSIHRDIEGAPIGQHPLVSRTLKGAFNERPPQPKYSCFWDMGQVLSHLERLGLNDFLNLQHPTLKTVMLLALTRPSCLADLSQLDINHRLFSPTDVIFNPVHLLKQSRQTKPLVHFFPAFVTNRNLCPFSTLKVYEDRTKTFRPGTGESTKNKLFLSLVGKHSPVTSSTTARCLNTCLANSEVDTSIFQAYSIRGAAASKEAASGVTVTDILMAADWSSEGTFQHFYYRPQAHVSFSGFGNSVLSRNQASNLHVDIETEPSKS